jgi:CRP-like cAMP-binding protein
MQAIEVLQDVTDEQLAELLDSFKTEKFEQGQTIVAQGEPGNKLYILLKGSAEVSHTRPLRPMPLATTPKYTHASWG